MGYLGGLALAGDEARHRLVHPWGDERVGELRGRSAEAALPGQGERRRWIGA